jgi:hypothetical protein
MILYYLNLLCYEIHFFKVEFHSFKLRYIFKFIVHLTIFNMLIFIYLYYL